MKDRVFYVRYVESVEASRMSEMEAITARLLRSFNELAASEQKSQTGLSFEGARYNLLTKFMLRRR